MSHSHSGEREEIEEVGEEIVEKAVLDIFESETVDQGRLDEKIKKFYMPIQYPICEGYSEPNLNTIRDIKKKKEKTFVDEDEQHQNTPLLQKDGLYYQPQNLNYSSKNILRQKIRIVRDQREQYYLQNGVFVLQKQFFQQQLSKLANISFNQNQAIRTFQKNSILSQRGNQQRQIPFQLQINFQNIFLHSHPLHNNEQKKFQQIRPYLRQYSTTATYPLLPKLQKQLQHFNAERDELYRQKESAQALREIEKKIELTTIAHEKEFHRVQQLMKKIIECWNEMKEIRKHAGIETVPFKLYVKEYQVDGKQSYDLGMMHLEAQDKAVGNIVQADAENKRRAQIKQEEYFLKIYFNGEYVGKSKKYHLQWPFYKIPLQEKLNVMVYSAPRSITVEIIRVGIINSVIDKIQLELPGNKARAISSAEKKIGSIAFGKIENNVPAGTLFYEMEWKGEGSKMPTITTRDSDQMSTSSDKVTESTAAEYYSLFDPRDPRREMKSMNVKVEEQFQKQTQSILPFLQTQSLRLLLLKLKSTNSALEKIQIPLKEDEVIKRQGLLNIINLERKRIIDPFEKEQTFNPIEEIFSKQDEKTIEETRILLARVKNLKDNAQKGNNSLRQKVTEQVLNEHIFEQMDSPFVIFFRNLFTQQRKLGPKISQKFQNRPKTDELEINLHVRSAKNFPIREMSLQQIRKFQNQQNRAVNQMHNPGVYNNMRQMFNMGNVGFVKPQQNSLNRVNGCVQLRFKKILKCTQTFQGPYPEWNQTLAFKYSLKNQSMTFQKIQTNNQKCIKILVYDIMQQFKQTQALSQARVKKTKFFIGKIQIPFSYLLSVPSVTGLFKIDRPLVLFQYRICKGGLFGSAEQEQKRTMHPQLPTFINIDLFTEPSIDNVMAYNNDKKFVFSSDENPIVLQTAHDWLQQIHKDRYVRLWLNNIQGKSVFICRYLSPNIAPPKLGEDTAPNIIERCARFVSLIPKKWQCNILQNTQQFHMKVDQFLNMKIGEDHGILLCNYFNYIDQAQGRRDYQSMLLIGKAFPYGKTIFVLRMNTQTMNAQIWDPYTGESYYFPAAQYETFCCCIKFNKKSQGAETTKDVCPLIEASCIVRAGNVYVNIQESVKPINIDFNVNNQALWKPFLNEVNRTQLFERGQITTIQPTIQTTFYNNINSKLPAQIQRDLYDYVRDRLSTERKNQFRPYTFTFNSRISNKVTNRLLPLCENFKIDARVSGEHSQLADRSHDKYEDFIHRLQEERLKIMEEVAPQKHLFGFPLNMAYTNKADIYEKVAQTQVHLDENQDLEFVLSVRVFQHACFIFSVWVFIGSIG